MTAPPAWLTPPHFALLRTAWPAEREQAVRIQAARNLLPGDDALLPGAVAYVMRAVIDRLLSEFPERSPHQLAWLAEAVVQLALDCRAHGLPVGPPRQ